MKRIELGKNISQRNGFKAFIPNKDKKYGQSYIYKKYTDILTDSK